jgi:hypothetical protein
MRDAIGAAFLFVALLPAMGSGADWTIARDGQFEVYSQAGEAPARAALQWFEQLHALVLQETGLDLRGRGPVRIVGFSSEREYEPYRMSNTSDAYYLGAGDRDYIVMPSLGRGSFPTAAHEYAHLIQHAAGSNLPPWLREGLAEMLSTVHIDPQGCRIGGDVAARVNVLRHRAWMPMEQLLTMPASSPLRENRSVSQLFYAQSWALTQMLALSPAYRPRFGMLIAELDEGTDSAAALASVYGKPLDRIKRDLAAWVDHPPKSTPLAQPALANTTVSIAQTQANIVQSMMAGLLLAAGDMNRAKSAYGSLAGGAAGSAEALAGMAAIEAANRHYEEARTLWNQAIDKGLKDADICFRYAELLDRDGGRLDERQAALELAVALQPDFDEARWRLALLENNSGRYQQALDQLKGMRAIPPARVHPYWNTMADALTSLGRREEAQAAAEHAAEYAATAEQRAHAAQLAYIARTRLEVQMSSDADGNAHLVTTRVENDGAPFNPFVQPEDDLQRVAGKLKEIECGSPGMRVTLDTAAGSLTLAIPDPKRVQMNNAPLEFTCGPQRGDSVLVEYAAAQGKEGIVRGIEFK